MSDTPRDLGGRLPLLDPAALSPARRQLYDAAIATQLPWATEAGFELVDDEHQLIGPFNAFVRRPEIASGFQAFSTAEAQHTSLSPELREVVILAVGSAWAADYEVYAHRAVARAAGITAEDAQSLGEGRPPEHLGPDAETAFALVRQLTLEHGVDQTLYDRALAAFGEEGLVDIAMLTGAYLTVSAVLTLFDVPAPDRPGHSTAQEGQS